MRTKLKAIIAGAALGLLALSAGAQYIYGNSFPNWDVRGPLTTQTLTTSGNATIGGTLTVTGTTAFTGITTLEQLNLGSTNTVILDNDAANILAVRNGTNGNVIRAYRTFTDTSNYERLVLDASGNTFLIGAEATGTGTQRSVRLAAGGVTVAIGGADKLSYGANDITFTSDNTYAIGRTATLRPSNIFAATAMQSPKFLAAGGTTPTMGACGTSPSVVGNDSAMQVTVGTGGAATTCAVTFAAAFANAPTCVAQSDTDSTALTIATATTTVTVTKAAAFTASSKLHIICIGR